MPSSTLRSLASLPPDKRRAVLSRLSAEECLALLYDWREWARPEQLPPEGDWVKWLVKAGRGFGKTRTGAQWVRARVEAHAAGTDMVPLRVALVAPTAADARDTMVEGESGLLAVSPPWFTPEYEPSKRRLTWRRGRRLVAIGTLFSAEEPQRLRGPQHHIAWADELAAWQYAETWDQLMFGLRLGRHPQVVITTTPRPIKVIRDLLQDETCVVTSGSTYANAANLAPSFLAEVRRKYEGTRLGRQELEAELLEDNPNALWSRARIDQLRVREAPELLRVVVGVDPAVTSKVTSDETGIVVAGLGADGDGYVLADWSLRGSPKVWARRVVEAYKAFEADRIVAEVNNGGDLVEQTIRSVLEPGEWMPSYHVVTATRGKTRRAEPVAALYEQGRVHHVGSLGKLEDQMCDWDPTVPDDDQGYSPDRMDAAVWALTELMGQGVPRVRSL